MKICYICRTENKDNAVKCEACGASFYTETVQPSSSNQPAYWCPSCGKRIDGTSNFCSSCGFRLHQGSTQSKFSASSSQFQRPSFPSPPTSKPRTQHKNSSNPQIMKNNSIVAMCAVIFVMIVVIAGGIVLGTVYMKDSGKDDSSTSSTGQVSQQLAKPQEFTLNIETKAPEPTQAPETTQAPEITEPPETVALIKPIPIIETTPRTTDPPKQETPTPVPEIKKEVPKISCEIQANSYSNTDGFSYYLNVSGKFDYYYIECYEYSGGTPTSPYFLFSSNETSKELYLTAGSSLDHVTAYVTPYFNNGTKGETVTVTKKQPEYTPSIDVYSCYSIGEISGRGVAGFTTDYVVNNGAKTFVRKELGDTWHVTAYRYCYSKGLLWYELYDTDDGDYYGWVDSNYIWFY